MTDTNLTLTHLFQQAQTGLRVFDLGRRIRALSGDEFLRIEQMQTPYPSPYLQHAWVALLLLAPENREANAVWFLKLPLDEQGFMIGAVRDDLLARLIRNFEQHLVSESAEDALKDNPYSFTPSSEKMAIFHALAARETQAPASSHYEAVQDYLQSIELDDRWQNLALQGLADMVIRLDQSDNERLLAKRLHELPQGLEAHLLSVLEHAQFGPELSQSLERKLQQAIDEGAQDPLRIALILRALSSQPIGDNLKTLVALVLELKMATHPEVLSAIATRCENWLMDPHILRLFLEALARGDAGQLGFSRTLADLMFLPVHRILIVQTLRQSDISDTLREATKQMFGTDFRALN